MTPTEKSYQNGLIYSEETSKEHKKSRGQFFTPVEISNFMASLSAIDYPEEVVICDPGCGPGILTCSLVERLVSNGVKIINADLFETDSQLLEITEQNLKCLKEFCNNHDVTLNYKLRNADFLVYVSNNLNELTEKYDIVISNPPYFKLKKGHISIAAVSSYLKGITNIYAGFLGASIRLCKVSGECIFIVPRSFTSGLYFKTLREYIFRETRIKRVHLFDSRTKAFKKDKVLQETIIFRTSNTEGTTTKISVSEGIDDIKKSKLFEYQITDLVDLNSEDKVLHLPKDDSDYSIIEKLRLLKHKLSDHNIKVSTGRVVAFRARAFTCDKKNEGVVPLIWGDNIFLNEIVWPLKSSKREQYIHKNAGNLLVPNGNYVVQRRFSAKEDDRRLVCSPIIKSDFDYDSIGFENKTNFFYRVNAEFSVEQVYGISLLLNSKIYDSYFRMINGNINVSSTEMRFLPFPSLETIENLGREFVNSKFDNEKIDDLVEEIVFSESSIFVAV